MTNSHFCLIQAGSRNWTARVRTVLWVARSQQMALYNFSNLQLIIIIAQGRKQNDYVIMFLSVFECWSCSYWSLPLAYVVRRKGNVLTRVCPSIHLSVHRGYPYPIMLCNISQNAMGQTRGGYPYPIMLYNITQNSMGQTPRGYPARSGWVGTLPGGYPAKGGTQVGYPLAGYPPGARMGVPCWRYPTWVPPSRVPPCAPGQDGGSTQLEQKKEYSLHGGQYASCIHAGGLSCLFHILEGFRI